LSRWVKKPERCQVIGRICANKWESDSGNGFIEATYEELQ